jgi:hypothetical protein
MHELLQEFADSRGVAIRVDREHGVIRGVKILGSTSRNRRTYRPEAMAAAVALYEGAKVNVNHPKGSPLGPRDYQDRIGVIRNARIEGPDGLFADLHFNPKHALAEQLLWDAEHAAENVGFSHNAEARTSRAGDNVVVEEILCVRSVDLVADPATTQGLFESAGEAVPAQARPEPASLSLGEATVDDLQTARPDLVAAVVEEHVQSKKRQDAEIERLQTEVSLYEKQAQIRRLLHERRLPDPDLAEGWLKTLLGPRFVASLLAAPNETAMQAMVEERAALARSAGTLGFAAACGMARPLSREQQSPAAPSPRDASAFAAMIVS